MDIGEEGEEASERVSRCVEEKKTENMGSYIRVLGAVVKGAKIYIRPLQKDLDETAGFEYSNIAFCVYDCTKDSFGEEGSETIKCRLGSLITKNRHEILGYHGSVNVSKAILRMQYYFLHTVSKAIGNFGILTGHCMPSSPKESMSPLIVHYFRQQWLKSSV